MASEPRNKGFFRLPGEEDIHCGEGEWSFGPPGLRYVSWGVALHHVGNLGRCEDAPEVAGQLRHCEIGGESSEFCPGMTGAVEGTVDGLDFSYETASRSSSLGDLGIWTTWLPDGGFLFVQIALGSVVSGVLWRPNGTPSGRQYCVLDGTFSLDGSISDLLVTRFAALPPCEPLEPDTSVTFTEE